MTVTYRSFVSHGASTSNPVVVNRPASLANGDMMVMEVFANSATNVPTVPAGWTLLATYVFNATNHLFYWKTADNEPATWDVSRSAGSRHGVNVTAWYSDTAAPLEIDAHDRNNNASGDRIFPSLTVTGQVGLSCHAIIGNTNGSTPPGGMTERWDGGAVVNVFGMTGTHGSAGATGTRTATGTAATSSAVMIAIVEGSSAPDAPEDLTVVAISPTKLLVTWSDPADADGISVERSPNGTTGWTEVADVEMGVENFLDTGLTPSTTYWYRIRSYYDS